MAKKSSSGAPEALGGPTLDLERYVPALITFIANKLTHGSSSLYRKHFGIGVIEWRCMALLAIEPWIAPGRFSQVIGLDKAAVSRSIRTLQDLGLVEVRANSQRSRFLEIALTGEGQKLHDRIIQLAFERERRLLADLTEAERETLISALNKMHRRIALVNAPIDPDALK